LKIYFGSLANITLNYSYYNVVAFNSYDLTDIELHINLEDKGRCALPVVAEDKWRCVLPVVAKERCETFWPHA
jgi:hypothetical protein